MSRVQVPDDLLDLFQSVTDSTRRVAYYYLSHNNNDINNAVSAFYDLGGTVPDGYEMPGARPPPSPPPSQSQSNQSSANRIAAQNILELLQDVHDFHENPPSSEEEAIERRDRFQNIMQQLEQALSGILPPGDSNSAPHSATPTPSIEQPESPENNESNEPKYSLEDQPILSPGINRIYRKADIDKALELQSVSDLASPTPFDYQFPEKPKNHFQNEKYIFKTPNESIEQEKEKQSQIVELFPKRNNEYSQSRIIIWKNGYTVKGKFVELQGEALKNFWKNLQAGIVPQEAAADDYEIDNRSDESFLP